MFTRVKFRNFKSLRDFTVNLRATNVFVGPNNAGKSTVLDAFRVMGAAHAYASRRLPAPVQVRGGTISGFDIPASQLPMSLVNVHSDYQSDQETSIEFTLENGNSLALYFYENSRCILTFEAKQRITNTAQFRKNFPTSIYTIPTLGPLEEEEELLSDSYVQQSTGTRRAHRLFRNIWHRREDEFGTFKDLVEGTWDGITISPPVLETSYPPKLSMFCTEGRIDREVYWAGFGFQIWLQLLTHIANSASSHVLVVDEPEIYLHPDLQHKLFQLLKATEKQIVLATHSAEMVNEAEHDEVIIINKEKRSATRVTDIEGLQEALFSIGSGQNIHLARLSRGKKLLFLEGDDYRLIRRLAARLGLTELANDVNITVVPIGGFSQRQRIQHAAWTFEKVLKADISIASLLDKDYRCKEEVSELISEARTTIPNFHILGTKEIENYLLIPGALTRAINEKIRERDPSKCVNQESVERLLDAIAEDLKQVVLSQHISNRLRYFDKRTSKDSSTVIAEAIGHVEEQWRTRVGRLSLIPGKDALAQFNKRLQDQLGISITTSLLVRHLQLTELSDELRQLLKDLNGFATDRTPRSRTRSAA